MIAWKASPGFPTPSVLKALGRSEGAPGLSARPILAGTPIQYCDQRRNNCRPLRHLRRGLVSFIVDIGAHVSTLGELHCRCGEVRGSITNPSPRTANRVVCYCDDCQ